MKHMVGAIFWMRSISRFWESGKANVILYYYFFNLLLFYYYYYFYIFIFFSAYEHDCIARGLIGLVEPELKLSYSVFKMLYIKEFKPTVDSWCLEPLLTQTSR